MFRHEYLLIKACVLVHPFESADMALLPLADVECGCWCGKQRKTMSLSLLFLKSITTHKYTNATHNANPPGLSLSVNQSVGKKSLGFLPIMTGRNQQCNSCPLVVYLNWLTNEKKVGRALLSQWGKKVGIPSSLMSHIFSILGFEAVAPHSCFTSTNVVVLPNWMYTLI